MTDVQIPAMAVQLDGKDLLDPLQCLLRGVNLLGSQEEMNSAGKASAAISGPPQSVALIEAGATAANKWWSAGLGATVLTMWGYLANWWGGQEAATQRVALWSVAVATAAAILGIAHLLGSDVRGRAAAAVATVEARAKVAEALIRASEQLYRPTAPEPQAQFVALPAPMEVHHIRKGGGDELDWLAVALMSNGTSINKYLLVKQGNHEWADAADVVRT
jgi:hypothetical protein